MTRTASLAPTGLFMGLLLTACAAVPVPAASPQPSQTSSLTLEVLRQASYTFTGIDGLSQTFSFTGGAYQTGDDPEDPGFARYWLIDEPVAYGDLDSDGDLDAALLLGENYGGTGIFVSLAAVLDSNGSPSHIASVFIDDRPLVGPVTIEAGEILAEVTLHGPGDPMCCPTAVTSQGYRLIAQSLVMTRYVTSASDGRSRSLDILSPLDMAQVSYPFTVHGSASIGPFENTLLYAVYDSSNRVIESGTVMTDSPEPGLPGLFTLTLDLASAQSFGLLRVEFSEYSMANGELYSLEAVVVEAR
ncbi:MAG: hypothetical protein FJZ96_07370 [Chloroflexi bacterium]|nr:hypothetical protein [Chloroflexota bacterium]